MERFSVRFCDCDDESEVSQTMVQVWSNPDGTFYAASANFHSRLSYITPQAAIKGLLHGYEYEVVDIVKL